MRLVNEIKYDVLSRGGRYREVYPEGLTSKEPAPLKVKEVLHNEKRYIVCMNTRQGRKDAADRQAIIASLVRVDSQIEGHVASPNGGM